MPLLFTEEAQGLVATIAVLKGGVTIGEIRKPKLASTYRYYPARSGILDPPALEDPDLESLKKRIADHLSAR
jgi:hypothetical protein